MALICLLPFNGQAQCVSFAKNVAKPKLGNFVHDGNYNATILGVGETAELYKTFFEGQTYRVSVTKIDKLPNIHFRLIDKENNVIFDNKDHHYADIWDFTVKSTQMLVLKLKVLDDYQSENPSVTKGCVAVLFGIKK
ncbi:hypothetical protein SAMN06265379_10663 [Saccharicrinis carchari]|uniref:Uncharacterized protein n=1 Tax=Saccharicrinis carchari TaxID=1168039 RepID=A0A521DNW4_SACCC|nr:hypothetical protein [Saccharicrinis carchari]SMO73265.1 hypothetical protein SAMN06265379_10663 [Saccharicrinis carchari]